RLEAPVGDAEHALVAEPVSEGQRVDVPTVGGVVAEDLAARPVLARVDERHAVPRELTLPGDLRVDVVRAADLPPEGLESGDDLGGRVDDVRAARDGTEEEVEVVEETLRVRRGGGLEHLTTDEALAETVEAQIGRATSELQSRENLVCRLLLEKKKIKL